MVCKSEVPLKEGEGTDETKLKIEGFDNVTFHGDDLLLIYILGFIVSQYLNHAIDRRSHWLLELSCHNGNCC